MFRLWDTLWDTAFRGQGTGRDFLGGRYVTWSILHPRMFTLPAGRQTVVSARFTCQYSATHFGEPARTLWEPVTSVLMTAHTSHPGVRRDRCFAFRPVQMHTTTLVVTFARYLHNTVRSLSQSTDDTVPLWTLRVSWTTVTLLTLLFRVCDMGLWRPVFRSDGRKIFIMRTCTVTSLHG